MNRRTSRTLASIMMRPRRNIVAHSTIFLGAWGFSRHGHKLHNDRETFRSTCANKEHRGHEVDSGQRVFKPEYLRQSGWRQRLARVRDLPPVATTEN
jgi:hypothetical protein